MTKHKLPCKKCQTPLTKDILKCPECGKLFPVFNGSEIFVLSMIIAALFGIMHSLFTGTPLEGGKTPEEIAAANEACRKDLHCWADKNVHLTYPCFDSIEKEAKYIYEWTSEGEHAFQRFNKYGWIDREKGIILYAGDMIRFQNGFGAWQPVTYTCQLDTQSQKILSVNVVAGRL